MIFQLSLAHLTLCKPLVKLLTFLFACFQQLYGHPVGITEMAHTTGCSLAAHLLLSVAQHRWQGLLQMHVYRYLLNSFTAVGWVFNHFKYTVLSQIWLYVVPHCHSHSSSILTNPVSYPNSGTNEIRTPHPLLPSPIPNEQHFLLRHQYNLHQGGRMDRFGEAGLAAQSHWGQTNHIFLELFCSPRSWCHESTYKSCKKTHRNINVYSFSQGD